MNVAKLRRLALIEKIRALGGGVAIIPTAPVAMRNSDVDYLYRPNSYFHYLTHFNEPEALLVIVVGAQESSVLFCRERNAEREIWDGLRYGPEGAREAFGFDAAYAIDALDQEMPKLLADAPCVYVALGEYAETDAQVQRWLNSVRSQARSGVTCPERISNVNALLDEMRLIKDASEIELMHQAAQISGRAHARAMRLTRPGMAEYQIEAELLYDFRRHGSEYPAYTSIVAAGANACILHYAAGKTIAKDGDLILIDAGCELEGYASDISRTYPANGVFSGPQRDLYELVFEAQAAALAAIAPGQRFVDAHHAATRVLAQGMLDFGLLDRNKLGHLDDVIANGDYRQFYMHRTGHWLGRDVHDVGNYHEAGEKRAENQEVPSRILHPGMVTTVEPGIYVRPAPGVPEAYWNIGIRIEDDVAVTADGHQILSNSAPKTIADIEDCMQLT